MRKEENEKATVIQRMYRDKRNKRIQDKQNEELNALISSDPNERQKQEQKAAYIQNAYRNRKIKKAN